MSRVGTTKVLVGLCVVLIANTAWAQTNPFVGRWHWNRAQSTLPPGEPAPNDLTAEISRMDGTHVSWSLTVLSGQGERSVESFEAAADGDFHPINGETAAAFHLMGNALQATFNGPAEQTDTLTCTLTSDQKRMTCNGVLSSGGGRTVSYVDVYDRM